MPALRVRHRPEESVLYAVVRDHLEPLLQQAREHGGLPAFIERTFRAYLDCGVPERGFIRVHCDACGHDDIVAFSCRRRGVCPSCSARAAGDGGAHLVDHVLPAVDYRQVVVSFPFEWNAKLAFQPELMRAAERMVTRVLSEWQRRRVGAAGQTGGMVAKHRFGSSLNLHVHLHALLIDGVYSKEGAFTRAPPLQRAEVEELAESMRRRFTTLLRRRGLLRVSDGVSNEEEQLSALQMCGRAALGRGTRVRQGAALADVDENDVEMPHGGLAAQREGMNVYVSMPIDGTDRERLERICRYLLRGPLALSRLKQRPDGMLTYRMKKPDRWGNTLLVLSPQQLLMRLCSLIPAPGIPVRKYFGVLAAGSRIRKLVVPAPTVGRRAACAHGRPAQSPVKWAELLRRVWGLQALTCARCGHRMRPLAIIEDPEEIARYLRGTGEGAVVTRSRGPPELAA